MSRKAHPIGLRLGLSNNWSFIDNKSIKYSSVLMLQSFLKNWILGLFKKWRLQVIILIVRIFKRQIDIFVVVYHNIQNIFRENIVIKDYKEFLTRQEKIKKVRRYLLIKNWHKQDKLHKQYKIICTRRYYLRRKLFFIKNFIETNNVSKKKEVYLKDYALHLLFTLKRYNLYLSKYLIKNKKYNQVYLYFLLNITPELLLRKKYRLFFNRVYKILLERKLFYFLRKKYIINVRIVNTYQLYEDTRHFNGVIDLTNYVYNLPKMSLYSRTNPYLKDYILSINTSLYFLNSMYLAETMVLLLQNTRRHISVCYLFLEIIKSVLTYYPAIQGVKIRVAGRFYGKRKKSIYTFRAGQALNLQKFDQKVSYHFSQAFTYSGVFGVKVYISQRDQNNLKGLTVTNLIK